MEPVILMVSCGNDPEVYDLEVMPDVLICDLSDAIASALQWKGTYDIEVSGTGRRLASQQCLADADIWDGARIRLVPSNRPARRSIQLESQSQVSSPSMGTGPVVDWQPIRGQESKEIAATPAPVPPPSSPILGWRHPAPPKEEKP